VRLPGAPQRARVRRRRPPQGGLRQRHRGRRAGRGPRPGSRTSSAASPRTTGSATPSPTPTRATRGATSRTRSAPDAVPLSSPSPIDQKSALLRRVQVLPCPALPCPALLLPVFFDKHGHPFPAMSFGAEVPPPRKTSLDSTTQPYLYG
jgi:hypothetical protein